MLSPSSKTKLKLSLFSCFYVVHVVLRIDYAFVGILCYAVYTHPNNIEEDIYFLMNYCTVFLFFNSKFSL
jgi:hypothetical protein